VQIINRKPKSNIAYYGEDPRIHELLRRSNKFTQEDLEKMEHLAFVIGRTHQVINKIEQLHSMKNHSMQIMDVANALTMQIDTSFSNFKTMGQNLKAFHDTSGYKVQQNNLLMNMLNETAATESVIMR
jgi:phosphatidate phosphatase PAH1